MTKHLMTVVKLVTTDAFDEGIRSTRRKRFPISVDVEIKLSAISVDMVDIRDLLDGKLKLKNVNIVVNNRHQSKILEHEAEKLYNKACDLADCEKERFGSSRKIAYVFDRSSINVLSIARAKIQSSVLEAEQNLERLKSILELSEATLNHKRALLKQFEKHVKKGAK